MDNELIIVIDDDTLKFKLKSQSIVSLEKIYGKNIFEIFQDLSFTSIQRILWESLVNKNEIKDINEMTDKLLKKYTLIEMGNDLLQELGVKSGILKNKDLDISNIEEVKND